jgi:hypothetical protein
MYLRKLYLSKGRRRYQHFERAMNKERERERERATNRTDRQSKSRKTTIKEGKIRRELFSPAYADIRTAQIPPFCTIIKPSVATYNQKVVDLQPSTHIYNHSPNLQPESQIYNHTVGVLLTGSSQKQP